MTNREGSDVLCFRVMRLGRPIFTKQPCEPAEINIDEIAGALTTADQAARGDLDGIPIDRVMLSHTPVNPAKDVFNASHESQGPLRLNLGGPGEMLNFTSSFGTTYLGETFSVHVNLYNQGTETCYNVELKVALHNRVDWLPLFTSGSHPGPSIPSINLSGSEVMGQRPGSGVDLAPGQSMNAVIHHELKELGVHTLRCTATYRMSPSSVIPRSGDVQPSPLLSFVRLYKFNSNKPLDVKKKFSAIQPDGSVFMEAQVQNLMTTPIFLERVIFEPSSNVTVTDLSDGSSSTSNPLRLLRPEDSQQFIYHFIPITSLPGTLKSQAPQMQQPPMSAGRLDITWRSTMGERGRLQTSSLKYEVPLAGDIQVKTVSLPDFVAAQQPFQITVEVVNHCSVPLDLNLELRNISKPSEHNWLPPSDLPSNAESTSATLAPIVWMGLTSKRLGGVLPGGSLPLTFDLLATLPGLQVITGMLLRESTSGREYEFNDLGRVLVGAR